MNGPEPGTEGAIDVLSARIDETLAGLLERGQAVALLNYPNIGNLGDAAIWVGTRAALDRRGVRVRFACEPRAYRRGLLVRALGDDPTVLLQGGGNLGDLYPGSWQHRIRLRVLRDLPRARVIQLPQSIWFRRQGPMRRFADLARAHPDFRLLVRERPSLARARDQLGLEAELCPDLALALGSLSRPASPRCEVYWLSRTGPESVHEPPAMLAPGVEVGDYPTGAQQRRGRSGQGLRAVLAANRLLNTAMRDPRAASMLHRRRLALLDSIARRRMTLACEIVSRGRVLVTDRFHGHALASLMGIPNVLLDNVYGKNRSLFEAWTSQLGVARWADDAATAQAQALELADGGGGAG